ncbi:peptidoglycan recognition protein family protein [Ruania halotolerans]|uniref:peptidoglycan recognition protein family protein n=1 Tax=Ruania halotolerans TaxID=2897773 RepID=UPI001E4E69EC|nr:N-acetylmuramoyl-L-alanine amidase [Ruania halotolerans]UFU05488.1 N-acetylmuramoyl-L-alanine amidase [Ruania halotolerans]
MAAKHAIASRASWGARYDNGVGNRPVGSLEKYLHHTVTKQLPRGASVTQERAQMRAVESIGEQRFGAGISYNIGIFPSGRIYEGASVHRISYHSGAGRNTRGVGIVLIGNTDTNKITPEQIASLVWLLQEGVRRGWWGDPAITEAHRDFKQTACPGRYAYAEIDEINALGRGVVIEPAPDKPELPPSKPKPMPSTKRRGPSGQGEEDTRAIQEALNALGYDAGLEDGDYGPRTTAAVKAYQADQNKHGQAGLVVDGDWGPKTQAWFEWVRKLQTELNKWRDIDVRVDGDYGRLTAAAVTTLQGNNGLHPDGVAGPITLAYMREHDSHVPDRP